jgi:hypothetical protein
MKKNPVKLPLIEELEEEIDFEDSSLDNFEDIFD